VDLVDLWFGGEIPGRGYGKWEAVPGHGQKNRTEEEGGTTDPAFWFCELRAGEGVGFRRRISGMNVEDLEIRR